MSDDIKKALVEVDLIIEQVIPKEQTLKIPKKFKDFIKNNKDPNYLFKYNFEKELEEQVLMNDTKILLGMLYLNYWATDDEKKEINHIFTLFIIEHIVPFFALPAPILSFFICNFSYNMTRITNTNCMTWNIFSND